MDAKAMGVIVWEYSQYSLIFGAWQLYFFICSLKPFNSLGPREGLRLLCVSWSLLL